MTARPSDASRASGGAHAHCHEPNAARAAEHGKGEAAIDPVCGMTVDPATTVMIGDRPLDVVAGQNAGVKGCFFDVDQFHSAPTADIIIDQLPEIVPYFQARN